MYPSHIHADVTFENFYKHLLHQFVQMERGWETTLQDGKRIFLVAAINVATQDLPQGNDKAMVKRQNAIVGCRACECTKDEIPKVDHTCHPRLHFEILKTRALMQDLAKTAVATMEKETGVLATPSPFEKISFDTSNPHLIFSFLFFFSSFLSFFFLSPPPSSSPFFWCHVS